LVINIKIENYGDYFLFTEPSSGEIQNTVLVHSVSAHTMGSHTVILPLIPIHCRCRIL